MRTKLRTLFRNSKVLSAPIVRRMVGGQVLAILEDVFLGVGMKLVGRVTTW